MFTKIALYAKSHIRKPDYKIIDFISDYPLQCLIIKFIKHDDIIDSIDEFGFKSFP